MTCRAEEKTEFQGLSSFLESHRNAFEPFLVKCGRGGRVLVDLVATVLARLLSAHHPSHHVTRAAVRKRRMRKNWEEEGGGASSQPQVRRTPTFLT